MDRPRFVFRFDVSPAMGTGHLRRCSTLAAELKERNAQVLFVCRASDLDPTKIAGAVADEWVEMKQVMDPTDDALCIASLCKKYRSVAAVVDLYQTTAGFQSSLCETGVRWLQFDAAGTQPLWADWVLNANPMAQESAYAALKRRPSTRLLLGTSYALLRPEFRPWVAVPRDRAEVRSILLTFGGGDDRGATVFSLEALKPLDPDIERVILATHNNPRLPAIAGWIRDNPGIRTRLLVDHPDVARRMAEADLAVTAGGTTTFETAASGLPSVIVEIAENQSANAAAWERLGTAISLGPLETLAPERLRDAVATLSVDQDLRDEMTRAGRAAVDGCGSQRVASVLLNDTEGARVGRQA